MPTVFENYTASFEIDTQRIELSLWDTSGESPGTGKLGTEGPPGTPSCWGVPLGCWGMRLRLGGEGRSCAGRGLQKGQVGQLCVSSL